MSLTITFLGILVIIILTAISGFFSSSELAVFSVSRHRIELLLADRVPGSDALSSLRDNPHRFLVTVLVSNNVANIATASIATAVLVQYASPGQAATGATAVTSVFVILFGEIAPKSYAVAHPERHALRVAKPIIHLQRVLRPLLFVFEVATNAINRVTGGTRHFETYLTREEIETIVISGERVGVLDTDEGAMIRGVLDLEETIVRSMMVPRTEMIAVAQSATIDEVLERCWRARVTRVPVFGDSRDDIRGIVDLRDALRARAEGASLQSVLLETRFVPGSKPVDELLSEMQRDNVRMVIVVDEFGTVLGLATFEDIIEEVVGEIFSDDEVEPIRVTGADSAIVAGWATVDYVNDALGLEFERDGPYVTIGGLVAYHTGRLAQEGDRVELGDVTITVLDATPRRVRRVRVEWVERSRSTDAGDDRRDHS